MIYKLSNNLGPTAKKALMAISDCVEDLFVDLNGEEDFGSLKQVSDYEMLSDGFMVITKIPLLSPTSAKTLETWIRGEGYDATVTSIDSNAEIVVNNIDLREEVTASDFSGMIPAHPMAGGMAACGSSEYKKWVSQHKKAVPHSICKSKSYTDYGKLKKTVKKEAAVRKNTHQTHFEDLITLGPDGLDEFENKVEMFLRGEIN